MSEHVRLRSARLFSLLAIFISIEQDLFEIIFVKKRGMAFQSFWQGRVVINYQFSKILWSIGESRDERWSSFNTSISVSIDFIF